MCVMYYNVEYLSQGASEGSAAATGPVQNAPAIRRGPWPGWADAASSFRKS